MFETIIFYVGGLLLAIIGFFLKKVIDDVEKLKTVTYETKSKVEVIENDYKNKYDNLLNRFDTLNDTLKILTQEIKELNRRIEK